MTDPKHEKSQTIQRLSRLAADETAPAKVRARAAGFADRLTAPTRIGLFGLPRSGKRELLKALLAPEPLPTDLPAVTTEFVPGEKVESLAMLGNGSKISATGYPNEDLMEQGAVFITVESPACAQKSRSYLLVQCDAVAQDLTAALRWAADRVDIAIWCSQNLSALEAQVWLAGPGELKNHAVLYCPAVDPSQNQEPARDFPHLLDANNGPKPVADLVSEIIESAVAQDIWSASPLLDKYATHNDHCSPLPQEAPPPAQNTVPRAPELARIELARLFNQLRLAALNLEQTVSKSEDPEDILGAFEELFEDLTAQVSADSIVAETWPDLEATLEDARDFGLLLRLEGGAAQATDAARLLLQIRYDMETKLAA
ncbi:MAG: hypothetical protein AAF393_00565 [Pseudomonadota bacterium]